MLSFEFSSLIDAPVEAVFAFHERPDALRRLTPPWVPIRLLERTGGIREGAKVVCMVPFGPVQRIWVASHTRYEKDRLFVDLQRSGPFRYWLHRHEFEPVGNQTLLTDRILFSLPGGPFTDWIGGWLMKMRLRKLFRFRHRTTRTICERQAQAGA